MPRKRRKVRKQVDGLDEDVALRGGAGGGADVVLSTTDNAASAAPSDGRKAHKRRQRRRSGTKSGDGARGGAAGGAEAAAEARADAAAEALLRSLGIAQPLHGGKPLRSGGKSATGKDKKGQSGGGARDSRPSSASGAVLSPEAAAAPSKSTPLARPREAWADDGAAEHKNGAISTSGGATVPPPGGAAVERGSGAAGDADTSASTGAAGRAEGREAGSGAAEGDGDAEEAAGEAGEAARAEVAAWLAAQRKRMRLSLLTEDALMAVASCLDAPSLARLGRCCTLLARVAAADTLWRRHCRGAARQQPPDVVRALEASRADLARQLRSRRGDLAVAPAPQLGAWRALYCRIPHVRFDVAYVLRQHYVRQGVQDLFHGNPGVMMVVSHRILRFYEDGKLQYVNAPGDPVSRAIGALYPSSANHAVHRGTWRVDGARVVARVQQRHTLVQYSLQLERRWDGDALNARLRIAQYGFCGSAAEGAEVMPIEELRDEVFNAAPLVRVA